MLYYDKKSRLKYNDVDGGRLGPVNEPKTWLIVQRLGRGNVPQCKYVQGRVISQNTHLHRRGFVLNSLCECSYYF